MSDQRDQIRRFVGDNPGVHFNEVTRSLDLAPGQVQYHVRKLRRSDSIVERSLYGRTHYYLPTYDDWEQRAVALLRRETARDILVTLMTNGATDPASVATTLDIARSTLEWHLGRLVEQDLVEKERDTRNHVTLVLARPEATASLLAAVQPSAADRLVDRFSRLLDGLLTGGDTPSGE